jgi:hypothetical protein
MRPFSGLARPWISALLAALLLALPLTGGSADAAQARPKGAAVLPAAAAKQHVGERRTVEMTVRSSNDYQRGQSYYLDSEATPRDPNNLAVVITYRSAETFRKEGIADPAAYYRGKTLHVTGTIVHAERSNQIRIYVTDPTQIEVIEAPLDNAAAGGDDGTGKG